MNLFTALRPMAAISRELKLIRLALTRLADAAERAHPAPVTLADAPEPPVTFEGAQIDYGLMFQLENSLRAHLGRDPDEEELLRAYEGEAEVVRARRTQ